MKPLKLLATPFLFGALAVFTQVAHATPASYQIKVLTVGSSAQYGVFAEAAYQLAKTDGQAKHFTIKGGNHAWTDDAEDNGGGYDTVRDYGDVWVVWSETTGNIWAYLGTDSVMGVRAFQNRDSLYLDPITSIPVSNTTNLFVWDDGSNDTALPTGVYSILSAFPGFTAANSDIRPEDALFATRRALAPLNTTDYSGLGYGTAATQSSGTRIQGQVTSGSYITPVNFELSFSTDSFGGKHNGSPVAPYINIPVGAAPILFIANKTNPNGLGASSITNITSSQALRLFSGAECDASVLGGSASVPVYPFLREPLSGAMNVLEAVVFRPSPFTTSQEQGINPAAFNSDPLNLNCTTGGGKRQRAIGTADEVKGVNNQGDGIGYAFFSFERLNNKNAANGGNTVNSSTSTVQVKYLNLDGIDPLGYSGTIPLCGSATSSSFSCAPATPSATFATLRNGTYKAWSEYRVITNAANQGNVQTLVTKAQYVADHTLPDFVPFAASCGVVSSKDEPGMTVYREHFTISNPSTTSPAYGIAPTGASNGSIPATVTCSGRTLVGRTIGGSSEQGGDVGGTIVYTAAGATPANVIETSPNHY